MFGDTDIDCKILFQVLYPQVAQIMTLSSTNIYHITLLKDLYPYVAQILTKILFQVLYPQVTQILI